MPLADPSSFINAATKAHPASSGSKPAHDANNPAPTNKNKPLPSAPRAPTASTNGMRNPETAFEHNVDAPNCSVSEEPYQSIFNNSATKAPATGEKQTHEDVHDELELDKGVKGMTLLTQVYTLESLFAREVELLKKQIKAIGSPSSLEKTETAPTANGTTKGKAAQDASSTNALWQPLALRNLPPYAPDSLTNTPLPLNNSASIPVTFLTKFFGGHEHSPGLYFNPEMRQSTAATQCKLKVKSKTYYILDSSCEPFAPSAPGTHGAKLSVIFNEFDVDDDVDKDSATARYANVPLFLVVPGTQSTGADAHEKRAMYMGHYTQPRWSDRLDVDTAHTHVPPHVRSVWADWLVSKDRPDWVDAKLKEHFWPAPTYDGILPGAAAGDETTTTTLATEEGADQSEMAKDLRDYIGQLEAWEKETQFKVKLLRRENVLEAFHKEDAAEEPGLRFWWEYLQCVGYDRNFHHVLASAAKEAGASVASAGA